MASTRTKIDWYFWGGSILLLWSFANTLTTISRYGIESGFYWWFCNLALIGLSGGLLFKHRGWLTGFVSIALFTQIFWVIDNQYRLFTGNNLFGLAEFMFQPGLPLDEFVLSHYHYVTIPIALVALYFLPKKKSNALFLISIFNPLIFAVSYFVFPKIQNINCIHEPCFAGLQSLAGATYSIVFWLVMFAMHLMIGSVLEKYFLNIKVTNSGKIYARRGLVTILSLALAILIFDIQYKKTLPTFKCLNEEASEGVQISCGYTLDYSPGVMLLSYGVQNTKNQNQICKTFISMGDETLLVDSDLKIEKNTSQKSQITFPYPTKNTLAHLKINCQSQRENASK